MKITILNSDDKFESADVFKNKDVIIGRDTSCDLTLKDIRSSRHHAKIYFDDSTYYLEDLNSTNGTSLNGNVIFKHPIKEGDQILIGDTIILFSETNQNNTASFFPLNIYEDESPTLIVSAIPKNEADLIESKISAKDTDDLILENKVLRKVCEISQILVKQKNTNTLLVDILDQMQEVLQADTACILIWSDKKKDWEIRATASDMLDADSIKLSQTIIKEALKEGMTILSKDPFSDDRFDPSQSIIQQGITSALCSPIKISDKFQGLLFFDRRKKHNVFNSMDLRLASTIANILEILLEKEQLEIESKKKERLAVIGEVIAGLAHYSKNIITGLRFSVNALEIIIQKAQYQSVGKCLKSISSQERRISELVLNMLSYSKDRKPAKTKLNLKDLMDDVFDPYADHLSERKIQYNIEYDPKTEIIFAEEPALHRVFLNLLLNAVDSLKHREADEKKEIKVKIEPHEQNKIQILFTDTGKGISKDQLDKIFNIFFSTKGAEGTGLGLAVVHKIITEHNGSISVDSQVNKWTEFKIKLPIQS